MESEQLNYLYPNNTSVVLDDSEVIFLNEGGGVQPFLNLYYILFIYGVAKSKK